MIVCIIPFGLEILVSMMINIDWYNTIVDWLGLYGKITYYAFSITILEGD